MIQHHMELIIVAKRVL